MDCTRRIDSDALKTRIVCQSNVSEQKNDEGGDDTSTDG
jgi:hypothetical protein